MQGRYGEAWGDGGALGPRLQARGEELDAGVLDVVVRGDHAQVERRDVGVVLHADAARRLEVGERGLDELGEVVGEVAVRGALQVVVVGVLREPAVHEGPREVVDSVLLVLDRLGHHLGAPGEVWGDVGRCGQMWGEMGRDGERWGDVRGSGER